MNPLSGCVVVLAIGWHKHAVMCSAPVELQLTQREKATHKVAFSLPIGAEETTPTKYRTSSMSYIPAWLL